MTSSLVLHGYWRSSASYRARIALNLKGVAYTQVTHDLRTGQQKAPSYVLISPQGLVPALVVDDLALIQSGAILEWLEERYPDPALLPARQEDRAAVRGMCGLIACDIHPLNNLRVLDHLRNTLEQGDDAIAAWARTWIEEGFHGLETLVRRHGAGFCFGARPTLADCYLVPQVYSAGRFGVDLDKYPTLLAVMARAEAVDAIAQAHPSLQLDADR